MSDQIKDKQGQPIEEGTHVYTKFRGGRHEGDVEAIATSKEEAEELGVKNPPKVRFRSIRTSHLDFVVPGFAFECPLVQPSGSTGSQKD